jgi:hypothetical protein
VKHHLSKKFLHLVYACVTFFIASVMLLWSWNTVSTLLGGPVAQYKHAVAALAFAYIIARVMRGAVCRGGRRWHEKPNLGS